MTLQNWYYALAIANSILWIIFLLLVIVLVIKIYLSIRSAPAKVQQSLQQLFQENKKEVYTMAGMTAFTILGTAIKRWFSPK